MRVSHLSLRNYRNYEIAELSFFPGLNLLLGRNGQGKTNLVEAIMFFATQRSHRTSQESALIQAGEDSAVMRMKLLHDEREALLELQLNRSQQNRAQLNRNAVRARDFSRVCAAVLFAPEDLMIVRGEPATRRRFLDDALISRYPVASGVLADYDRVLRQRNALLKSARGIRDSEAVDDSLSIWDEQLVLLGSQIIEHRRRIVRDLSDPVRDAYRLLVDADHHPTLRLVESMRLLHGGSDDDGGDVSRETVNDPLPSGEVSRETISQQFRVALQEVRGKERDRGQTLVGPHRDDVLLSLNHLPAKGYASHGESWSMVLALRIGMANLLRADSQLGDPLVILDDVFAELDHQRRERLASVVSEFEQVIVTAAVAEDVPRELPWSITNIHAGTVLSQHSRFEQLQSEPAGAEEGGE